LDRANRLTGVTTDTQALWSRTRCNAMMERRHDQTDSAAVDVPERVASYLLIGWADVGAGRTTDTAQSIFETRISAHLAASVVDEHNVHLFLRCCWTSDK